MRYGVTHSLKITSSQDNLSEPPSVDNVNVIQNPLRKKSTTSRLFWLKETKCKTLQLFIEAMENDLFNPSNIWKPKNTLNNN